MSLCGSVACHDARMPSIDGMCADGEGETYTIAPMRTLDARLRRPEDELCAPSALHCGGLKSRETQGGRRPA
jgi:sugar lactone lactonase YvrE